MMKKIFLIGLMILSWAVISLTIKSRQGNGGYGRQPYSPKEPVEPPLNNPTPDS
jgi:hypothetical protein